MAKYEIQANTENCTGCLRCQLSCSDLYTKAFNPAIANLQVAVSDADCAITFTEDCTKCGVCVDNCFYGALQKSPKENV